MTQASLFPATTATPAASGRAGPWSEGLPPVCTYLPDWLGLRECDEFARRCRELRPRRVRLRMYGRDVERPRATAWLAENGRDYLYGGAAEPCRGWPGWAADLAGRIAAESAWAACRAANGVLLNFYESGADRVAWHADDEPEVDQDAPIASLSVGAARRFHVRRASDHTRRYRLVLEPGSLLIVPAGFQRDFEHAVPPERNVGPRWNLTFRVYRAGRAR